MHSGQKYEQIAQNYQCYIAGLHFLFLINWFELLLQK